MSRIHLQVYERTPDVGIEPVWIAIMRADGSHARTGMVDVVRAVDGRGDFHGRYIRLSSDSPVALSPQFSEVEVYETLMPTLVSVRADDVVITADRLIEVPPGTQHLQAVLTVPCEDGIEPAPIRWRLKGVSDEWQKAPNHTVTISRPSAGRYAFEAQARHSDGEWNESTLSVPVVVAANFWEVATFWWFTGGGCLLIALTVAKETFRRRESRRVAEMQRQSALADERARIARDMHDEVGARLSQIALMQDIIIREHDIPEVLRRNLSEVAATTRRAAHALDHVVWAVNPLNDTLAELAGYLSHEASSYLAPLNISCRLELPCRWPDVPVRAQVRNQLTLAFHEALQNVVKHAHATGVTVEIEYDPPWLTIRVRDNGWGLPAELNGAGKDGIVNMSARLESIGGRCAVRGCDPGPGTEVEFSVSLHPVVRT